MAETDWRELTNRLLGNYPQLGIPILAARKLAYEPLKEGAQFTKDVYKGNVNLQDPKQTATAMSLAPMAMAGTMPLAYGAADLGIFGGRLGAKNLSLAGDHEPFWQGMKFRAHEETGMDKRLNHELTGWHRGITDKKPKFEINDQNAKLLHPWDDPNAFGEGVLKDYFDHPELYKAYPDLADYPVKITRGMYEGRAWDKARHGKNLIEARGNSAEQIRSVLLHEIQHTIQNRENFGMGSNQTEAGMLKNKAADYWEKLRGAVNQLRGEKRTAENKGENTLKYDHAMRVMEGQMEQLGDLIHTNDYTVYRNAPGEKESSNVQLRQDWGPATRRENYPPDTANVAASAKFW